MHAVHGTDARGFTLLELLVAIAVAAVLFAVAIPSYRGLVSRNAIAAQVNDLVGDLNYARSQAVTRGKSVYLCKSKDQNACISSGDWSQGWIVYAPDVDDDSHAPSTDNLLRAHGALADHITISGGGHTGDAVSFDANGFAMNSNGSLTAFAPGTTNKTDIVIATTGRIRTDKQP